jgi:hypothetical protein
MALCRAREGSVVLVLALALVLVLVSLLVSVVVVAFVDVGVGAVVVIVAGLKNMSATASLLGGGGCNSVLVRWMSSMAAPV